jgi:hypothetical protein
MSQEFTLIGIDGGATKVNGWILNFTENPQNFSLSEFNAEKKYSELKEFISDFTPVALPTQLQEMETQNFNLSADEIQQGGTYIQSCAEVIEKLANQDKDIPVVVGIGMPGLKTEDKRGLSAVANGPRMPHYSEKIETILKDKGINFLTPIAHLGSDADYCGIGENYSDGGGFRDVYNAYYLGGGTGAADALKLRGELVPLDKTKSWLAKTWEMKNESGISLERYASASGIQFIYSSKSGISTEELNENEIYPPQIAEKAIKGEPTAIDAFKDISKFLALLFYDRITCLYCGTQNPFEFVNPNRAAIEKEHFYINDTFERIVIGQRLGDLMSSETGTQVLTNPLKSNLNQLIEKSDCLSQNVKEHYLNKNILFYSKLREAPALGAGIDAYLSFTKNSK